MLRSANKIIGHRLSALDGEIGRATDFLLDDGQWVLRYLVVETGAWLAKRRVLIAPAVLNKADWTSRRMVLEATREQVKTAPVLEADMPSRQHELELSRHYGWNVCGLGDYPPDPAMVPLPEGSPSLAGDPHLSSVKELVGYGLEAQDGNVGHIEDFIVEDDTWSIRYLVIDSRSWLSGRKLLIETAWLGAVNHEDRQISVQVPGSRIEALPDFDPGAPVYERVEQPSPDKFPESDAAFRAETGVRSWSFGPPESWRTRGLRAALARIIHG
jgi:PRC-barrel domain protein